MSKITGWFLMFGQIAGLVWCMFYNGDMGIYNLIVAWNWITKILGFIFLGFFALVTFLSAAVAQATDKRFEKAKVKMSEINPLATVCNAAIIALIAYSGAYVSGVVIGMLFIGTHVFRQMIAQKIKEEQKIDSVPNI